MSIEKTVSEIAEILGVSRQAVNNRVKQLPEEDLENSSLYSISPLELNILNASA